VLPELPALPLGPVDDPGAAILKGPEPGMAGPDVAFPPRPPLPVVGDKHRVKRFGQRGNLPEAISNNPIPPRGNLGFSGLVVTPPPEVRPPAPE